MIDAITKVCRGSGVTQRREKSALPSGNQGGLHSFKAGSNRQRRRLEHLTHGMGDESSGAVKEPWVCLLFLELNGRGDRQASDGGGSPAMLNDKDFIPRTLGATEE